MADSRFEKLTRSVIESDHPIFSKVRKELPKFNYRSAGAAPEWRELWSKRIASYRLLPKFVAFAMAFVLSFFIYRQINTPYLDYSVGDIAQRHLVAPRTLELLDEDTTATKRKIAVASVLPVYDYDRHVIPQLTSRVRKAFTNLRHNSGLLRLVAKSHIPPLEELAPLAIFQEAKRGATEELGVDFSEAQFYTLLPTRFSTSAEQSIEKALAALANHYIVSNRELLLSEGERGVSVNRLGDSDLNAKFNLKNVSAVLDLESANKIIEEEFAKKLGRDPEQQKILAVLTKKIILPNLTLNRHETEQRRHEVLQNIKPTMIKFAKGESIIHFGETIAPRHLSLLRQLELQWAGDNSVLQLLSSTIFLFIMMYSFYSFAKSGFQNYNYAPRDLAVFLFLMIASIMMLKATQFLATEAFMEKFPQIPFDFYYFLVPVAAGPVVIRMITVKEAALVFCLVLGVVSGIVLERNFFYTCYVLASSLTAVSLAHRIKARNVIYSAGFYTGLVNVLLIACIVINSRNAASFSMLRSDLGWIFWAGMLSGFLSSLLAVALLPLIELFSGHTSDLRLLELANMNHPLLRDLMVKAPGTYHHSIVIGSLVEAAAEAIGANPLLARVMSYYHDVGKMERPLYFIENQGGGYNRHDGLQPHMSAMIIREHVKRGQELGRKHKLPEPLIAAMSEHHGSSTIWYFYNKARSLAEDPESVLESDYKYDGQKPQSKETALVMLGDVVEAATRSVPDPSPLRLSGVVKNILNKYFAEGQLSECDLTLRDLDRIASSFLDVLLGIYHARIEYGVPSLKENAKRKGNAGTDAKGAPRVSPRGGVSTPAGVTPIGKAYQISGTGGGGSRKS